MSGLRAWLVLFALTIFSIPAFSQNLINAPDLYCVKNDTLFWDIPVNTCGPFQSYLVYGSTNPNGPYALLASITDPAQTFYIHTGQNMQIWYYYMQSAHTCPGFIRRSSDTLSTLPPPLVPINAVSVVNGQPVITWSPSLAPQVDRYIIYRSTPSGTIAIDTVFSDTFYVDAAVNPGAQSEIYYVLAADRCGNTSLFDLLHQTMLLNSSVTACTQSIDLNWNTYLNWPLGIEEQVVWVSANGGAFQPVDTLASSADAYTYTDADAVTEYCFFIEAKALGSAIKSRSNQICFIPDVVQPPREMQIKYIGVSQNQTVSLEWVWETYAELELAGVGRSTDGGQNFLPILPVTITTPLLPLNTFSDQDVIMGPTAYEIFARDNCGVDWNSVPASPIYLNVIADINNTNKLNWTPLEIEAAIIESYTVYEARNGLLIPLGTTNDLNFEHIVSAGSTGSEPVCYVVEAIFQVSFLGGQERRFSQSNLACARQDARIWVPNAFAPRGINTHFRPLIRFGDPDGFEMVVFSRWGSEVFRTNDLSDGWDGKINGEDAAPGVYTWTIKVRDSFGETLERQGVVMLVR